MTSTNKYLAYGFLAMFRLVRKEDYDNLYLKLVFSENSLLSVKEEVKNLEHQLESAKADAQECRRQWMSLTHAAGAQAKTISRLHQQIASLTVSKQQPTLSTNPSVANPSAHLQPRTSHQPRHSQKGRST